MNTVKNSDKAEGKAEGKAEAKGQPIWSLMLGPGEKWSGRIGRGHVLRLTSLETGANVSALFYNAGHLLERYNLPDTLKAQHTFRITRGHCLYSDMGRILCSVVEDSLGWHDTVSGHTTRELTEARYGATSFQRQGNAWLKSGRENFLVELGKYGLGTKDLVPNLNVFSKVSADAEGRLQYDALHSPAGASVGLRLELDTLVILSNTPNALDTRTPYPSVPVVLELFPAQPVGDDDYCLNFRPENARGFRNNREYHLLQGLGEYGSR